MPDEMTTQPADDHETTDQHTQADDMVERLRTWSPLIASGYECPAASTALDEAAAYIKELKAEVERLRALIGDHDLIEAGAYATMTARAAKAEEALRKALSR